MALHLFRNDLRAFCRNRQARFFTLALPVLFLVIFARPSSEEATARSQLPAGRSTHRSTTSREASPPPS
jgi:hypothetical protein